MTWLKQRTAPSLSVPLSAEETPPSSAEAHTSAAQLGTAFIACPESSADEAYRVALAGFGAHHTVMTHVISGRPARCLANRFTQWGAENVRDVPDYPIAYDAGKALNAAVKFAGESGFGPQWAGQGAPLHRVMPAGTLVELLWNEASRAV